MEATPPPTPPPPPPAPPAPAADYPIQFDVDYPERDLNRVTTFFRLFTVIPILIVLAAVGRASYHYGGAQDWTVTAGGGLLFLPVLLLMLFRQKYPRWWFDFNLELQRFANRVYVYFALLTDVYPSTDEHQSVRLDYAYPDAQRDLNRWLPLVKWLLAIPHYVVLFFLGIGAFFVVIAAWFAILFTGRYPRGIFAYVVGVHRWANRVGHGAQPHPAVDARDDRLEQVWAGFGQRVGERSGEFIGGLGPRRRDAHTLAERNEVDVRPGQIELRLRLGPASARPDALELDVEDRVGAVVEDHDRDV